MIKLIGGIDGGNYDNNVQFGQPEEQAAPGSLHQRCWRHKTVKAAVPKWDDCLLKVAGLGGEFGLVFTRLSTKYPKRSQPSVSVRRAVR